MAIGITGLRPVLVDCLGGGEMSEQKMREPVAVVRQYLGKGQKSIAWRDRAIAHLQNGDLLYASPQASAAVPEGILSIARRMVEESKENDHCTAHPVFIVQKRRIVTGIDTEYTDSIAWVSEGEILDATESSALEAAYQETGQVPGDYTRTGYCEEWEHIDTYLTERAALSRCSGAPDYRVTVESAYRNKEMQIVRAFLMSLAASQPEVKS